MLSRTYETPLVERPVSGPGFWRASRLLAGILFVLCVLALTPSLGQAADQAPWVLPATDLSAAGQNADGSRVAIGPDGTAVAVWASYGGSDSIVQAATRPPGGSFGDPVDLSTVGQGAEGPEVAIGPDGTVTVVWQRSDGSHRIIQAATRPPGGSFGDPVDLSAAGQHASDPLIAVGPDGTATAVWQRSDGTDGFVQARTRPPGGSFGDTVDLSEPGEDSYNAQIALGLDGTATVVWQRSSGPNLVIQAATRPPGGSFGDPVDLSATGAGAVNPQVAAGSGGRATVVWNSSDGSNSIIRAVTRPPGGSFGLAENLSAAGQDAREAQIAIGPDGSATAVWRRSDGSNQIIQSATRPPGGTFGTVEDLSASGQNAEGAQVAIGPDGTATSVWYRSDGSNDIIQTSDRPTGGSFGTAGDLSASGQDAFGPGIAIGPDGAATAVWQAFNDLDFVVQTASREAPVFNLTVDKSGDGGGSVVSAPGGIDCGSDCSEDYSFDTQVTLTATPDTGSGFTGFSGGGCSGPDATCEVTMDQARAVTATFAADPPVCPPRKLKKRGLSLNKKNGTAKLKVTAGGAGKVILKGSKGNKKSSSKVGSSGKGKLKIRAKGKAAKKLKKKGKVKIKVKFTYKPGSGCPNKTASARVKLVKK